MRARLVIRRSTKLKQRFRLKHIVQYSQVLFNILITTEAAAVTKTSISSGDWDSATCWSPAGKPNSNDDVFVLPGHTLTYTADERVNDITVASGGKLNGSSGSTLFIYGDITVNGQADMNNGNIELEGSTSFKLGPHAVFVWSPGDNTSAGATLFTNGIENFHSSSTLVIKRWYDYTTAIGEVVSGNFGNLTINSPGGANSIVEWNQKNYFQSHNINGTLTIDQGWVTLDKSGSISSTTIGNITLTSVNSTFIAHSGTHPSAFTVTTTSVSNNGGKFYGLQDGNGKVTIHVAGNFTNSGNVKIINNSGVGGVSNGDAVLKVDGDYIQSSGDTRIIYNITTTNSGTFSATIRNLTLNGGIFMGQSACHTGGQINSLNITQDLTVNFSNAADKFRGAGLTSIGPVINNAGFALIVGRNMTVGGTTLAEFTSSASAGDELVNVHGNMTLNGCTSSFNYGTPAASHASELLVQGDFVVNGGSCCMSRNGGTLHSVISKDLRVQNGLLVMKGNTGDASVTVEGSFLQDGGSTLLHSNAGTATNNAIQLIVQKTFTHKGGTISFDDNLSGAQHIISLRGDTCIFSGNGSISRAGAGTSSVTGMIKYEKAGKMVFQRVGNSHVIDQAIQVIGSNCELFLKDCSMKIASHNSPGFNSLKILPGGMMTMDNAKVITNGLHTNCSIYVDSATVLSITNEKGMIGSQNSVFGAGTGYFLHSKSIVEYSGAKPSTITGLTSQNNQPSNKYGILRIKLQDGRTTAKLGEEVYVRTKLELIQGGIKLNGNKLTIENGNTDAIKRVMGFVESDIDPSQNAICWKNLATGVHEFPFGRSTTNYLPVRIKVLAGQGNEVTVSTRRTKSNNLPYPANTNPLSNKASFDENNAIDRWWTITSNGVTADVMLTYSGDENTLSPNRSSAMLNAFQWKGNSWTKLVGTTQGMTAKCGTASLQINSGTSHFAIAVEDNTPLFELESFDAAKNSVGVLLNWATKNESGSATYVVEKSNDGIHFHQIGSLQNDPSPDNTEQYEFSDNEIPQNVSFYRIRIEQDNSVTYSDTKSVTTTNVQSAPVKYKSNSVSPNPFTSTIKVQFGGHEKTILEVVDAQGRKIFSQKVDSVDAEVGYTTLNLDFLKKGAYFLNIISNGKKDTMKIIKNE